MPKCTGADMIAGARGSTTLLANRGQSTMISQARGAGSIACDFTSGDIENYRITSPDDFRLSSEFFFRAYE